MPVEARGQLPPQRTSKRGFDIRQFVAMAFDIAGIRETGKMAGKVIVPVGPRQIRRDLAGAFEGFYKMGPADRAQIGYWC